MHPMHPKITCMALHRYCVLYTGARNSVVMRLIDSWRVPAMVPSSVRCLSIELRVGTADGPADMREPLVCALGAPPLWWLPWLPCE